MAVTAEPSGRRFLDIVRFGACEGASRTLRDHGARERSSNVRSHCHFMDAILASCVALGAVTMGRTALAQPREAAAGSTREITGTVLDIDQGELIVDVGRDAGAREGGVIEIWRPLKLRHPVTGKTFNDRFLLGSLELIQVRDSLSLARPSAELLREPAKGDVVILVRTDAGAPSTAGKKPAPEGVEPGPPMPTAAPADAEARAVGSLIESLRGTDLVTRIRGYEAFVRAHPDSRYARTFYEEAAALRELHAANRRRSLGENVRPREQQLPERIQFAAPPHALERAPLRIALELTDAARGAVMHVRRRGEPAFRSTPMAAAGDGYWAATIAPDQMIGPDLQYFIEATTANGAAVAVVGSPEAPLEVDVLPRPRAAAARRLDATVSVWTDYADYNRARGNDRAWQTEGYFGVRFGDVGVRALRSGFGVYRGVGGGVAELDEQNRPPREIGLTYGYLEMEVGAMPELSFIGRAVVGLLDDGTSGGGQLLVRIGNDRRTNLVLGGELLGGVGARSIAELNLNTFERFPILLRTEVTNQPAGGSPSDDDESGAATDTADIGARGIAQLGFRPWKQLAISARGSFQGRTIKHAGPGFGGGMSYEW
jgi:hypothetical protein